MKEKLHFGSPEDLRKEAEGKVWRMKIHSDELPIIDKIYPVITTVLRERMGSRLFADEIVDTMQSHIRPILNTHMFTLWRKAKPLG